MVDDQAYVTLEWQEWLQNPQFQTINFSTAIGVPGGGTGLTGGISGGVLAFTSASSIASSGTLTLNALVLGGGLGGVPSTPVGLGTATTVLHGNFGGAPTWGPVSLTSDVTGTISLTAQVSGVLPAANGGSEAWASYAPTRTGWTDVGSATTTGRYSKSGNTCFFQVKVVPATSVASVLATSYVSLPVAAAAASIGGDASMVNLTTLAAIGDCVFDTANSRCYVPAQLATGNTLTISGWFEC